MDQFDKQIKKETIKSIFLNLILFLTYSSIVFINIRLILDVSLWFIFLSPIGIFFFLKASLRMQDIINLFKILGSL